MVKMTPVASRSIASIGYEPSTPRLVVLFRIGYRYAFHGVPRSVFDAFLAAPSKGRFFNRRIRGRYLSMRAA